MASSVSLNLPNRFKAVFEEASRTTGAKFDFLVHTAKRESGLNASAKAPTSSATGLFQFVEQTWLETMKEAGPKLGYEKAASQITQVGDKYYVRNAKVRQQILDMRKDPKAATLLAGAYAGKNEVLLEQRLDRKPSAGELYAAHFLGAQGSGRLIELVEQNPDLKAATAFPQQARANRNIFFDKSGQSKSVEQVYENLVSTVPEQPKPKSRLFNLGEWFKPKSSMKETRFANAEVTAAKASKAAKPETPVITETVTSLENFFSQPAQREVPSRFGMSYSPDMSVSSNIRSSRYAVGDAGQSVVSAAMAGVRSNRVFSNAVKGADEAGGIPLPRRKPVTADVYVDGLSGMLPRPKPIDLAGDLLKTSKAPVERPVRRHGALDLTAFLDRNVFASSKKA